MRLKLSILLFFLLSTLFYIDISNSYAKPPIVTASEIASLTLRVFYDSGAIDGYVIFRDGNGEMCAVDFFEPAWLSVYDWSGKEILRESLGYIKVSDFNIMRLKNQDAVYAYAISPIVLKLLKDRKYKACFEWGRFESCKELINFYDE